MERERWKRSQLIAPYRKQSNGWKGEVMDGNKERTCSDSIRAFRISSLLFEIGSLSSPSLFVSNEHLGEPAESGQGDSERRTEQ